MVWAPRATVAAIIEQDGLFLMVEEMSHGQIVYNQPAGHLDPGESLIDAVIRECREETAWLFHPEYISGLYQWTHPEKDITFMRTAFHGSISDFQAEQPLDTGIIRTLWMSREELLSQPEKLRSPMVIRCIDDYLSGQRYPVDLISQV